MYTLRIVIICQHTGVNTIIDDILYTFIPVINDEPYILTIGFFKKNCIINRKKYSKLKKTWKIKCLLIIFLFLFAFWYMFL